MNLQRDLRRGAFLAIALAVAFFNQASANRSSIKKYHRAICIDKHATVEVDGRRTPYTAQFGELFKVAKIDGARCLVFSRWVEGWIDVGSLVSIGDDSTAELIRKADASAAEKEFALANFHWRRNRRTSDRHFERAAQLDSNHLLALFELASIKRYMGDKQGFETCLKKLKKHKQAEEYVLSLELDARSADQDVHRRCGRLLGQSIELTSKLSGLLINSKNAQLMPAGTEFARKLVQLSPNNPAHHFALANAYEVSSKFLKGESADRVRKLAANAAREAIRIDGSYWRAHETLASLSFTERKYGEAIRLAQATLQQNPLALDCLELISVFHDKTMAGEEIIDGQGVAIPKADILRMREVSRGAEMIARLDLPLLTVTEQQLHGWARSPSGIVRNQKGQTMLHVLIEDGNGICLNYLAAHYDLDWNQTDANGRTPMQLAIVRDDVQMTALLVDSGISCETSASNGVSSAQYAASNGKHGSVLAMIDHQELSDKTKADLRKTYRVSNTSDDASLRTAVRKKYDGFVTRRMRLIRRLAKQHSLTLKQLRKKRKEQEFNDRFIPRDAVPFLLPEGIELDLKDNPVRARTRIYQKLRFEVDQDIANRLADRNIELMGIDRLNEEVDELRRTATLLLDGLVWNCRHTLPKSEFSRFESEQIPQIRSYLKTCGIRWDPVVRK